MKKTTKLFAVALIFLIGVQIIRAAVSNPPETPPSAPIEEAASVLSFFCGNYTDQTSIKDYTGTSGATVREVRQILGDDMIYIEDGFNSWESINFTTSLDISGYEYLNFDIYIVSGTTPLKIKLSDNSTDIVTKSELPEGWNKIKLKLSDFKSLTSPPDLTKVAKIMLLNGKGYKRTAYIDNIYASGKAETEPSDPELPAEAAPAPTHNASDVKSFFSDAYPDFVSIDKISGTGTLKILTAHGNNKILKIENGLNHWANLHFKTPVSINSMTTLHLDIYLVRSQSAGNATLKFRFNDIGNEVKLSLKPGWNNLDIPLTDFKGETGVLVDVDQFRIIREGGYPINVFIDNLYTYGNQGGEEPEDPYAPKVAAPTPIQHQDSVKSIFSDHYQNLTLIEQNNAGTPVSTMTYITPLENDSMLRLTSMNWTILKLNPALDLDDMDYLHFDVYAEAEPKIVIGFGNWEKYASTQPQSLEKGWKSFDIPMSVFKDQGVNLKESFIMRLHSSSGFAIGRLYFDNIFAYKGNPSGKVISYEIVSAYEPIMAPQTVKSIYTEKYKNITELEMVSAGTTKFNFQWLTETDITIKMHSLDKVILQSTTTMNLDDMENIHLNVYYKTEEGLAEGELKIGFQSEGSEETYYSNAAINLTNGKWSYVNVPLDELKSSGLDCSKIKNIVFEGAGNIYVDNVFAFKGEYALGLEEEGKISVNWEEAKKDDALPDRDLAFLGVNLSSAAGGDINGALGQSYTYPAFEDLYYFKSKGVRLFRFPFRWERVQHEVNGPLDMELDVKEMKKVIAEAERIGMYVMIDMHDYCRRNIDGVKYKFGDAQLTKEHFADVWTKLATEFKEFDNIWGYDIMNEPYGLMPGAWKTYAQAAINGIRTVDVNTPIVIEGESYASASTWPTTGGGLISLNDPSNNLIFQAHCYFDRDKSGLYVLGDYDKEVSSSTQHIDRLKPYVEWLIEKNVKGILGEFGVPRSDVRWLTMLDEVLAYLKENKVSGTYWVAGNGYANDHVSVQPLWNKKEDPALAFTQERAQMRILEKYIPDFHDSEGGNSIDEEAAIDKGVGVKVYPNPVTDWAEVNAEVQMKNVKLLNITGATIKSINTDNNQLKLNLEGLSDGIYILQITFIDGSTLSKKIIKR